MFSAATLFFYSPDVLKSKELINNAFTSIQRPGRLYMYHSLSLKARTYLNSKEVSKNALTSIQMSCIHKPECLFQVPGVFSASTVSL